MIILLENLVFTVISAVLFNPVTSVLYYQVTILIIFRRLPNNILYYKNVFTMISISLSLGNPIILTLSLCLAQILLDI